MDAQGNLLGVFGADEELICYLAEPFARPPNYLLLRDSQTNRSNAKLIAAAPELLSATLAALQYLEDNQIEAQADRAPKRLRDQLREAIDTALPSQG